MTISDFTTSLRELLAELESNDNDGLNPNDVSNLAEELRSNAEELRHFATNVYDVRYKDLEDAPGYLADLQDDLNTLADTFRDQADAVESWV